MSSDSPVIKEVLQVITDRIVVGVPGDWDAHSISYALYGMQNMNAASQPVQRLIQLIHGKLISSNQTFSAADMGAALYGLRRMTLSPVKASDNANVIIVNLLVALTDKCQRIEEPFNMETLSRALNGLRYMSDELPEVRELVVCLAKKLLANSETSYKPKLIANMLAGLTNMKGGSQEARLLVSAIYGKLKLQPKEPFPLEQLVLALYSLQSISLQSCPEVKYILQILLEQLESITRPFTLHQTAMSLYGLRNLSSENISEVNNLLIVLADKIKTSSCKASGLGWRPAALSMAMVGIKGLSGERKAVRYLLSAIATHPIDELDPQSLGNILLGMNEMSSKLEGVRQIVAMLVDKIPDIKGKISPQEMSNALYGLKNMDSREPIIRKLVKVLSRKLHEAMQDERFVFTSQGIGNALSGLQTMSNLDGPEVIELVGLLADITERSDVVMSPCDISNALFGLQGMTSDCENVRAVLIALLAKFKKLDSSSSGASNPQPVFSIRDIGYCLTGMNGMQRYLYSEVEDIMDEINLQIAKTNLGGETHLTFMKFGNGVRVKVGSQSKKP